MRVLGSYVQDTSVGRLKYTNSPQARKEEKLKLNGKIILASQSPRRKELLKQVGLEFECVPSEIEEVCPDSCRPEELPKYLSEQKATAVAEKCRGNFGVVIGADTVVIHNEKILGKPSDSRDAVRMLKSLQGDRHKVVTGVTLIFPERKITFSQTTIVYMYSLTQDEIEEYVKTGEPLDKAGAYGIQGRGAAFVEKIDGDYNNVVGLPIASILRVFNSM